MKPSFIKKISSRLERCHNQILDCVERVDEQDASKWLNQTAPSIKWHLWHMGRWADYARYKLLLSPDITQYKSVSNITSELWNTNSFAELWSMENYNLGTWGVGAELSYEESKTLPLPDVNEVLKYASLTFDAFQQLLKEVPNAFFNRPFEDWHSVQTTVEDTIIGYIAHANRHLGMIEAILGVLGYKGSATI